LPAESGASLNSSAEQSFDHGARIAFATAAGLILLAALFVLVLVRSRSEAER